MKTSIILLIPIIMCLSCGNYADIDIVYYEKTFTESQQISQNLQLPFCIVLYDSLQITPQKYLDKFHANEIVLNKGIICLQYCLTQGVWPSYSTHQCS